MDAAARARATRVAFLLFTGAYLALSAWLLWRSAVLAPYSDMIDWLDRYLQFRQDGNLATYLLAPHNFHRLPITFGVLALDAGAGANSWILIAAGTLALAATAALLAWEAGKAAPGLGYAGGGLAAMLTLMAGNLLDASIHINTSYVHGLVFALAALSLAEPSPDEDLPRWRRGLALLAGIASALGSAVGLAVWPVLLFAALRNRADRGWIAAVALGGAAVAGLYAGGEGGVPALAAGGAAAKLALACLALPWTRIAPQLGWMLGAAAAVIGLAALVLKGGVAAPRAERVATRLILFSLVAAAMIGLGRGGEMTAADVPLRYAVFMAPLQVGIVMLALPYLARIPAPGVVVAVLALALLAQQFVMGQAAVRTTDVNRQLVADFRAGRRTPQMVPTVHNNLARAEEVWRRLDAAGLYRHELHLKPNGAPP